MKSFASCFFNTDGTAHWNQIFHKMGCLAGGYTITGFTFFAKIKLGSGFRSNKKMKSSSGWFSTILFTISNVKRPIPSNLPLIRWRVFIAIGLFDILYRCWLGLFDMESFVVDYLRFCSGLLFVDHVLMQYLALIFQNQYLPK